jgi:hypothetical protein
MAKKKIFQVTDRTGRSAKPYIFDGEHIKNTWDLEEENDSTGQTLEEFLEECEVGEFWDNGNDVRIECVEIQITSSSTTMSHNSMTIEQVTKIWEFFQKNIEIDFGNTSYYHNDNLMIVDYVDGVFKTQELWDGQSGDMGEDLTLGQVPMNVLKTIYEKHSKE